MNPEDLLDVFVGGRRARYIPPGEIKAFFKWVGRHRPYALRYIAHKCNQMLYYSNMETFNNLGAGKHRANYRVPISMWDRTTDRRESLIFDYQFVPWSGKEALAILCPDYVPR